MSILTGRSVPPAGESPLDARLCAEVGAELARVRVRRGLSLVQVGDALLLSVRQVKALEEVEFSAFHNATFHVKALKKYATFAELDPLLVNSIASAVAAPDVMRLVSAEASAPEEDNAPARRGLMVILTVLALAAAVGAAGYLVWARRAPAPVIPVVTEAVPMPAPPPPPPVTTEPLLQTAVVQADDVQPAVSAPGGFLSTPNLSVFGSLRVAHSTWIFVRDADNVVTERLLGDGETFELETQPTYLAIGNPDAVLMIGTTSVDVSRFVSNGQVRIRAGDFDALVQGAFPIPAPTAAVR